MAAQADGKRKAGPSKLDAVKNYLRKELVAIDIGAEKWVAPDPAMEALKTEQKEIERRKKAALKEMEALKTKHAATLKAVETGRSAAMIAHAVSQDNREQLQVPNGALYSDL